MGVDKRVEFCDFGKPMVTSRVMGGVVVFFVDPTTDVEHERDVINTMMEIYNALEREAPTPAAEPPPPPVLAPPVLAPQFPARRRYRALLAGSIAATTVGAVLALTLAGGSELADPPRGGMQVNHDGGSTFGGGPIATPMVTAPDPQPPASPGGHLRSREEAGSGQLPMFTPKPTTAAATPEQPVPSSNVVSADSPRDCPVILCRVAEMLVGHA
jgi:hypothetical protein